MNVPNVNSYNGLPGCLTPVLKVPDQVQSNCRHGSDALLLISISLFWRILASTKMAQLP